MKKEEKKKIFKPGTGRKKRFEDELETEDFQENKIEN